MQNLSGHKLGNYELRERLGRGGMAEVYKAYQPSMDRFVAVKVMLGHLADDDNFIERFKREAQAVGRLRHPHIIQIFDFGIQDDIYYMAMEYVTGGNLKQHIVANQKLPLANSLKIAHDLADALIYAHQSGMIHRDLKPANVMFIDTATSDVVLTDFGIARILGATGITGSGMSVGTPAYMSPEAGRGEDIDERADIYALGIILYEMLVGEVPYDADTPLAVIMKHISAPLPTRAEYGDNIPEDVERIVLKCLAKDREDRFASAKEFRDALADALKIAPNIAKTEAVQSPQPSTEVASENATEVIADYEPTVMPSSVKMKTIDDTSKRTERNLIMGGIATIIILAVLGGLYLAFGGSGTDNPNLEDTPIPEVALSVEDTPETDEPTELLTETLAPSATPLPTATPEPLGAIQPPFEWNLQLLSGDINPDDPRNIEFEIEQLLFENRLEDAESLIRETIENAPNPNIDDYAALTRLAVAQGNQELALQSAETMLDLDPNNPNAHINLLDAMYMSLPNIDYDRANDILEAGQALVPDDLAFVWRRIPLVRDWDEKLEIFNEAETQGAQGWRFVLFAGEFLYDSAEYQRAIPYLERALELPDEIFNLRDTTELRLQQSYQRLAYATLFSDIPLRYGGILPPDLHNLNILTNSSDVMDTVDSMVLAGDLEGAIAYVDDILADDPDNADALFARSQLYTLDMDEENRAGQDANRLIELQPDNPLGYIALHDSWFNYPAFEDENAVDNALSAIQQAYDLAPENPHVLWRLASIGNWELERERMYSAQNLGARGYRFILSMGEFLYNTGDYEAAIPYLEVFMRGTESDTSANQASFWNLLGALIQENRAQTALQALLDSGIMETATHHDEFGAASVVAYEARALDLAQDWSDTALALSPDSYGAIQTQGLLAWTRDGDYETALNNFNMLAEADVSLPFQTFGTLTDLSIDRARMMTQAGRYEEAIDYYTIAIDNELYLPFLYEERAEVYLLLDQTESAQADFREAFTLETDPELREYYRQRLLDLGASTGE